MENQELGRPARTIQYVQRVILLLSQIPEKIRANSQADKGIPRSSINRSLRNRIHSFPCTVRLVL